MDDDGVPCTLCDACEQGSYISNTCPTHVPGAANCTICGNINCARGTYLSGCDGSGISDTNECLPHSDCAAHEYISHLSMGSNSTDTRDCAACATCPGGMYIQTACNGSGHTNTSRVCEVCDVCTAGNYISVGCDGAGNASNGIECTPCASCAEGYYISGCDGSQYNDTGVCTLCDAACIPGTYSNVKCQGNEVGQLPNSSCTACNIGNGNNPSPGNYWIKGNYWNCLAEACEACPTGQYMSLCNATLRECKPCDTCGDGEYISTPCAGGYDESTVDCEVCEACLVGEAMTGGCSGNTSSSERSCANCDTCDVDEYIHSCTGNTTATSQQCLACQACSTVKNSMDKTVYAYATQRCNGASYTPFSNCSACQCPDGIGADGRVVNDWLEKFPIESDYKCTDGLPNHSCRKSNQFENIESIVNRIGQAVTETVLQLSQPTTGVDFQETWRQKILRNIFIETQQSTYSIVCIIFGDAFYVSRNTVKFWVVYSSAAEAALAVTTFNLDNFNVKVSSSPFVFLARPRQLNLPVVETPKPNNTVVVTPDPKAFDLKITLNGIISNSIVNGNLQRVVVRNIAATTLLDKALIVITNMVADPISISRRRLLAIPVLLIELRVSVPYNNIIPIDTVVANVQQQGFPQLNSDLVNEGLDFKVISIYTTWENQVRLYTP